MLLGVDSIDDWCICPTHELKTPGGRRRSDTSGADIAPRARADSSTPSSAPGANGHVSRLRSSTRDIPSHLSMNPRPRSSRRGLRGVADIQVERGTALRNAGGRTRQHRAQCVARVGR